VVSFTFYVYCDVTFSPAHVISWLYRAPPSTYSNILNAACGICASKITSRPIRTSSSAPSFGRWGIVDISFQRAATGKCATPTTHLIRQFDYLAATYELIPLAESKTIVYLLVWTQLWFPVSFWWIPRASLLWKSCCMRPWWGY